MTNAKQKKMTKKENKDKSESEKCDAERNRPTTRENAMT